MQPHSALLVPDIVHDVFRYFDLDHWQHAAFERDRSRTENARLRALAASARVCTVFRDAALPVLWGSLCNVTPLVRLLSSCIKEPLKTAANAKGSTTGPYVFRIEASEIPSHEKERLTYYGSLVRKVDTNAVAFRYCERGSNVYSHSINPSSWTYLQVLVGDLPAVLLPNLQCYTVDFGHPSELAFLRLGASPSLLRVDLHHRGVAGVHPDLREEWQSIIDQLLSDVIPIATRLESFKLKCRGLQLTFRMAASIARAPRLRFLELLFFFSSDVAAGTNPLWHAFPLLCPLKELEKLVLYHDLSTESPSPLSVNTPSGLILPQLRELELFGTQNVLHLRSFLQLVQSTTLQRIDLKGLVYSN
ncbi:hypothetical protein FKP32DRAFT_1671457, partial [Trametes sanguinea]